MQFEMTKEFLEQIVNAANSHDQDFLKETLSELHAADVNLILMELNTHQSKYVIDLLDTGISAEIISELDSDIREKFIQTFEPIELAILIPHFDSDDAADILNEQRLKFRE